MKIFLNELDTLKATKIGSGLEADVFEVGDYAIKRITVHAYKALQNVLERNYNLHVNLMKHAHPYIAPILDIKKGMDEKYIQYIEVLKHKYMPLSEKESQIIKELGDIVRGKLGAKKDTFEEFKPKALAFVKAQDEQYKENLMGVISALGFINRTGIDKYINQLNGKPYYDLHDGNVMKDKHGMWKIIDF